MNITNITIIIILLLVPAIIIQYYIPQIKGYIGEKQVRNQLSSLPDEQYKTFYNIMLRTEKGETTQIDHIVVSIYGIFVIETKNYRGTITGTENAAKWTKHIYKKKYLFQNPIRQNYGHRKALENLLKLKKENFISIITFTDAAKLRVKTITPVIYVPKLTQTIKTYTETKINPEQLKVIADTIHNANIDSLKTRKEHVKSIKAKK